MKLSDHWKTRLLYLVGVLVAVGISIPFLTRKNSEWDNVYRPAAQRLLADESLYQPSHGYSYPPLMALLATPVAHSSTLFGRVIFLLVNLASAFAILLFGWRLTTSEKMIHRPTLFWAGLLAGGPFFLHALSHQQNDILVGVLAIMGAYALVNGRGFLAALSFGVAAALKCTPLLFAPLLVLKGRPFAAMFLVIVSVVTSLLPDLVNDANKNSSHLEEWYEVFIANLVNGKQTPGVWGSEMIYNQSLIGAANRWTRTSWVTSPQFGVVVVEPILPERTLKWFQLGCFATCGMMILLTAIRGRNHPQATAWQCALISTGMLLLSPMSSIPHSVVILLPAWLIAKEVIVHRRWSLAPFLCVMILSGIASNKDLFGGKLYTIGLWYGSIMWGSVAGFMGCVYALVSTPQGNAKILPFTPTQPRTPPSQRAA